MIGDQIATDIQAGKQAGLPTVLVTTGVPPRDSPALAQRDFVVSSLAQIAIPVLVGRPRQRSA
nr:HAD hydrolase-like protein [Bradyrhizobium sp. Ghvi]